MVGMFESHESVGQGGYSGVVGIWGRGVVGGKEFNECDVLAEK